MGGVGEGSARPAPQAFVDDGERLRNLGNAGNRNEAF
jgi:hypothetical protein